MKQHKYYFKFKYDDNDGKNYTARVAIEAPSFNPDSMSDLLKVRDAIKQFKPTAFNVKEVNRIY